MYTAYVLTEESRNKLKEKFPPKYSKFIGHHITYEFGVDSDADLPSNAEIKVIGYKDSGDGLEVLVVSVDGTSRRKDGNTYHITWSLEPEKYKPVDSNKLLSTGKGRWKLILPIKIEAIPELLK